MLFGLFPLLLVEVLSALIKFFLCLFGNIQFRSGNGAFFAGRLKILRFGFDLHKFCMIGPRNGNGTGGGWNDPAAGNLDFVVSWFQIQENNWTETIGCLGVDKAPLAAEKFYAQVCRRFTIVLVGYLHGQL